MILADLKRRGLAAAYLARRLVLRGESQRFAPSAAPAFRPDAPAEQGVVDGIKLGVVRGWARRLDRPSMAVAVDVYLDDQYLGRTDCGLRRADLARLDGFADGGCGFAFSIPDSALVRGGDLRVFAAASGLELSGGPVRLEGWRARGSALHHAADAMDDVRAPFGGATSVAQIAAAYGRRLAILTERDPACTDAGYPVTASMSYVNTRYHSDALPCRGAGAYCDLLLTAAEHFTPALAGLPMSAAQVDLLRTPTSALLGGRIRTTVLIDHVSASQGEPLPRTEDAAAKLLTRFVIDVLVRRRLPIELVGESATRFLAEPARGGTRFLEAFAASPLFASTSGKAAGLRERAGMAQATAERLGLGVLADLPPAPAPAAAEERRTDGVRIVTGDYGGNALSDNARQSARALQRLGVNILLSQAPVLRSQQPAVFAELGTPVFDTLLLHVQPDDAVEVILRLPQAQAQARLIGFYVWETESLPAAHRLGARLADEIWTASDYCRRTFAAACPGTSVVAVGHAVDDGPPAHAGWNARAWAGVGPSDFLVLFAFDAHAWITRKNPVAAVRAFRAAFADGQRDTKLLIKIRHADEIADHQQEDRWAELAEEAAQDPRIRIANEDLDGTRMAAVTAAADVYLSLHRSEGFGYGVAEAMLAAKPVIVSDYGGTQDFVSPEEGLLVPAVRRRIAPGEFFYGDASQVWGEPDVATAARALRTLHADRALCARLGAAGRRRMLAQGSVERLAEQYARHLATPAVNAGRITPRPAAGLVGALAAVEG